MWSASIYIETPSSRGITCCEPVKLLDTQLFLSIIKNVCKMFYNVLSWNEDGPGHIEICRQDLKKSKLK